MILRPGGVLRAPEPPTASVVFTGPCDVCGEPAQWQSVHPDERLAPTQPQCECRCTKEGTR